MDGVVVDGEGIVDTSAVTGEQLPVAVTAGVSLHAGSVLLRGRIVVRASAVGPDTALGRIIARVERAQTDRAPIQTVGETFSRRFVPASLALSALTLLATRDFRRAMTMLLVACPCAVGLSTPTAISAAHEECEVLLGQGMRVHSDGRVLLIGSRELLRRQRVPISRKAHAWVRRSQRATETPLLLAVDGKLIGLVSLRDSVRPESREVLDRRYPTRGTPDRRHPGDGRRGGHRPRHRRVLRARHARGQAGHRQAAASRGPRRRRRR